MYLIIITEEQKQIFLLISAVLRLGNIVFIPGAQVDSAQIENKEIVEDVCKLLGVDAAKLEKYLCMKRIKAGNEFVDASLKPEQAAAARDSLSMLLYSRMFDW
jgi:myosin-5